MQSESKKIPNIFHFVYGLKKQDEPFHLVFYLCLKSCLEVNRPDAVCFYYHHLPHGRYWDLIRDQIIPIWIPLNTPATNYAYKRQDFSRFRYAHESDFIRLEKLIQSGGIYADLDTIFVNRPPTALHDKAFVLGQEDDVFNEITHTCQPSLCNAFIMAEKNARFGKIWLAKMADSFNGTWSEHSTLLPAQLAQAYPELIHIEPPRTFYKHMWTCQGLHDLLKRCDPDVDGVVSMHLWAHIWWKRRWLRRQGLHSGLLTESYIRQVETTYNLLARPYLPKPSGISLATAEVKWLFTPFKKKVKGLLKKVPLLKEIRGRLSGRSRNHTDEFLARFFASDEQKIIVQVGANDGIMCDPLRRFFQCPGNYRAMLIEPIPYYYKKLEKLYENRADISLVNAAVGEEATERRLYFISPAVAEHMNGDGPQDNWAHGQGSFEYDTVVYWIKQNAFRGKNYRDNIPNYISSITYLDVPVVPIRNLMPQAENVLLVVDVQGAEYEVLCGLDWRHSPEYIIIEVDLDQTARAIRLLYYHGYHYICGTANKVYKRSD